jgi:hypothetical protein
MAFAWESEVRAHDPGHIRGQVPARAFSQRCRRSCRVSLFSFTLSPGLIADFGVFQQSWDKSTILRIQPKILYHTKQCFYEENTQAGHPFS